MNVPELRFPEFEGEWEEKSLDDILSFKNGINAPKEDYGEGIKFINVLDILNNDYITYDRITDSVKVTEEQFKNYSVGYGNVLFQRSSETREEVGTSNVYLDKEKKCVFGGFVIRGQKSGEYEPFFLKELLKSSKIRKEITSRSGGSTRYNIGQESLKMVNIFIPYLKEQKKASFLSKMDKKIEKLEKKEELWQIYKKGMMQQLFSQSLRFKDDDWSDYSDWEEKNLNEFVSRVTRKNKNLESDLPLTISAQHGLVNQETFFNKKVASKSLKDYYLLKNGEFAYNKSYSNGFPWGAIRRLDKYDQGALSTLYICFSLKENFNSDFMVQYFLSDNWHKEVSLIAVEGARAHGLLNVGINDFFNTKHIVPSLSEQEKIGAFLSAIDKKIENIQKELEINKKFKKGLLQQMFPTNKKSEDIKTKDLSKLHDKQEEQAVLL